MVMCASFIIGYSKRRELSDRVKELDRLIWETGQLRAKITGCCLSLEECFSESRIFAPAAEGLRRGVPPEKAVLECGIKARGLELFAAGLGAETAEGQKANVDAFAESLKAERENARDELEKKGRLYVGLAVLAGAAACIILL